MSRIIANNIRHNDASADSLSLDSSARVGIGETSPQTSLHVTGANTAARGQFVLEGTSADARMTFYRGSDFIGHLAGHTDHVAISTETGHFIKFSPAGSEAGRFLSGGGLTFNGDTATANALDDYEEGTWTPNVSGVTAYGSRVGRYTKIGRLVYLTLFCDGMNVGFNLNCEVTNLPFTIRETYQAITITHNTYGLNGGGNGYFSLNGSNFLILSENSFSPQASNTGTNRGLIASGCYLTDT